MFEAGLSPNNLTILHCTSEYPTPMNEVNLRAMHAIKKTFEVEIGYSDHSKGIEVAIAATALGAKIIEKHFTMDRRLEGPDHRASLEPDELKAMVVGIRNIEKALGDSEKTVTPSERKNRDVVRKSIVALREIKKGEVFTELNITTKRPGTGMSPMSWDKVIGAKAKKDFSFDELIVL
jgi:N,N'-diacetyllegionaminate synthase